ncbi:response regulator transcription factor [Helicovermis profundi]|uniref:Stage 0 sporulation protein A homolog n=1 Tax=Helicovermis profundi TaxID=3065157 RepID=A0AAU9EJ28_9FIRM|nr:response regulator transcription factor [Clostridia bacterium S502]
MNPVILIVDDDNEIRKLIDIYMKSEGYNTILAENGLIALEKLKENSVDVIILDVMMPIMNGIETCVKIREDSITPIIMLSAKSEDLDKIYGLTSGADDYLTKPFNPLELTARVKSQIRRNQMNNMTSEDVIEIDNLHINLLNREVKIIGEPREIKLTPIEYEILVLLAKNKNRVLTNKVIYESVWNEEFYGAKNSIMVHIRKIREKIENDPKNPKFISTVWGVGYMIEG